MNAVVTEVCAKLGASSLEDAAELCAERVLFGFGINKWPVPLAEVGVAMGVSFIEVSEMPYDAALRPLPTGGYKVMVSKWATPERARFSVAHELGHIVLHQLVPETRKFETRSVFMPPGHHDEESFCDHFASRLLMPLRKVLQLLQATPLSLKAVDRLAASSGASLTAAAVRLQDVCRVPCGLNTLTVGEDGRVSIARVLMRPRGARCPAPSAGVELKSDSAIASSARKGQSAYGWEWIPLGHSRRARRFAEFQPWASGGLGAVGVMLSAGVDFRTNEYRGVGKEASHEG